MSYFILFAVVLIFVTPITIYNFYLLPPKDFPKQIPIVPFYVSLLALFKDVDQVELYKRYMEEAMEKYGAVAIFFGARWNVLVGRAALLQEVFKDEDVYAKSGNQQKIPYSVLAQYTGENIISAHGTSWRHYAKLLKPGLQKTFDLQPLVNNTNTLISRLTKVQQNQGPQSGVSVGPILQKYALACLANSLLATDFGSLDDPNNTFDKMQMALKAEIFKPIYLSFPILDKLPIPSRIRARKMVKEFRAELASTVLKSHRDVKCTLASNKLGEILVAARQDGILTEKQFQDNLTIVFVAGHENPHLLMVSAMYLLAKAPEIQRRLREEVFITKSAIPDAGTLQSLVLLNSVIYEALRLFPPISQLINRRVSAPIVLGGHYQLMPGTYVGYNCYAAGRDKSVWGDNAEEFDPDRWGKTIPDIAAKYRNLQSRAMFPAFHGGRRACLGERFALLEMRVMLWELVQTLSWELDSTWKEQMTPAGPLYPRGLKLIFRRV